LFLVAIDTPSGVDTIVTPRRSSSLLIAPTTSLHSWLGPAAIACALLHGCGGAPSSPAPGTQRLGGLAPGEFVPNLGVDDTAAYAAIVTGVVTAEGCQSSRWVRLAKDGSGETELGSTQSCVMRWTAPMVVGPTDLYWIANSWPPGQSTVMSIPKTGGQARAVLSTDQTVSSLRGDGTYLYVVETGTSANAYADGSVVRVPVAGGASQAVVTGQAQLSHVEVDGDRLVWAAVKQGADRSLVFWSAPANGGTPVEFQAVPDTLSDASGFANGLLYFNESDVGGVWRVQSLSMQGAVSTVVAGLSDAYGVPDVMVVESDEVMVPSGGAAPSLEAFPRAFATHTPLDPNSWPALATGDGFVYYVQAGAGGGVATIVRRAVP
jgi:hypothetical protein